MGRALGPFLAALRSGRKRRATPVMLVLAILLLGLIGFGTFMDLRDQRRFLDLALTEGQFNFSCGDFTVDATGTGSGSVTCRFTDFRGNPIGPEFDESEVGIGPGVKPGFPEGPPAEDPARKLFERHRAELEPALRANVKQLEDAYAPLRLFGARARAMGTLWGVLVVVLLGATLFGAEWRWSVWRTLLTHEPRRWLVLAGKFAALWALVAAGSALLLAALAGIDQIFRHFFRVGAGGGPGIGILATQWLRSLLVLETYATIAAAGATLARTSMVGLGAPLALLLADGLLTQRFLSLRPFSAAQQVAWLIPQAPSGSIAVSTTVWFPRITEKVVCRGGAPPPGVPGGFESLCNVVKLPAIPQWRAIVVLLAWTAVFGLVAYASVRRRDVPQ